MAFSNTVAELKDQNLLQGTITVGMLSGETWKQ